MKKQWLSYVVEVAIALLIAAFSLKALLVYMFVAILITLDRNFDYIRKLVRVFQVSNEARLNAIQEKVGVTIKDLERATAEIEDRLTEEQLSSLKEDISNLFNN